MPTRYVPPRFVPTPGVAGGMQYTDGPVGIGTSAQANVPVTVAQGTITDATPALHITSTWNDAADTFGAVKVNVTNTASATASKLLDLQVGGSSVFSVRKDGQATSSIGMVFGADGFMQWSGRSQIKSRADGTVGFANAANTGLVQLDLGPATGNSASGSTSIKHINAVIDMATATGTGTGTITYANFFPADSVLLAVSARVSAILAGAGLGTWSIGPTGDLDAYGAGLAVDAGTLVGPSNYTVTAMGQVFGSATNLVITASGGVFSTGVLKVTATVIVPVAVSG